MLLIRLTYWKSNQPFWVNADKIVKLDDAKLSGYKAVLVLAGVDEPVYLMQSVEEVLLILAKHRT